MCNEKSADNGAHSVSLDVLSQDLQRVVSTHMLSVSTGDRGTSSGQERASSNYTAQAASIR